LLSTLENDRKKGLVSAILIFLCSKNYKVKKFEKLKKNISEVYAVYAAALSTVM
jgi:hypothetical protein